jgi:hypothetical protein
MHCGLTFFAGHVFNRGENSSQAIVSSRDEAVPGSQHSWRQQICLVAGSVDRCC